MRTVIFFSLTLIFASLSVWGLQSRTSDLADTLPATGVIVDLHRESSRTSSPVVQFTTNDGRIIEQTVFRKEHTTIWDKGNSLPLLYKKSNPQRVIVNEFSTLWHITLSTGLFTLGFGILSIRRILPTNTSSNRRVKSLRALSYVVAFFALLFAVKLLIVT
ncbi:DUF3592 domain-containing protein [Vreelandella stevensii]|uniref:DUF3592 domain-containing protein n=1 Tax=Vreelandella stevensii TaxID=502821 RepID=UPI003747F913